MAIKFGGEGRDTLYGGAGFDILYGLGYDDYLSGGGGTDILLGGHGIDTLHGGAGADVLDGGIDFDYASYENHASSIHADLQSGTSSDGDSLASIEGLIGSEHGDYLAGNAEANKLWGKGGDDILEGRGGGDEFRGGEGRDWASYYGSTAGVNANLATPAGQTGDALGDLFFDIENLDGSQFADVLGGDDGANELRGEGGDDRLTGRGGADWLAGGSGHDELQGGLGADVLEGGLGIDSASFADLLGPITADLASGQTSDGDTLIGIEGLVGSDFNDVLRGNAEVNTLNGQSGDDILEGRGGADVLVGSHGSDWASYQSASAGVFANLAYSGFNTGDAAGDVYAEIENLLGSGFDDELWGDIAANEIRGEGGADRLDGGNGNDTLLGGAGDDHLSGSVGADALNGGDGFDFARYDLSSGGITANLATAQASDGDTLVGIEGLVGSGFGDMLVGNAGGNRLEGLNGNDFLTGGGGADALVGGSGNDWASYLNAGAGVTASLGSAALNTGDALGDTYSSIENLRGSLFADTLTGDAIGNVIEGQAGADQLDGRQGNDVLIGGTGRDTLSGGDGNDTFRYLSSTQTGRFTSSRDVIRDFADGEDKIDLRAIDANTTNAAGTNDSFKFIGTNVAFSGAAGQLRAYWTASGQVVEGDINGDKIADFSIALNDPGHVIALSGGNGVDFWL